MATAYMDELNAVLSEWGAKVAAAIKSNLDTTGTTASGRTRDSVEVVVENGELFILGRPYFRGVEEGRGAGKIPYNFTDILHQWMKDKGIAGNFGDTESKQRNAAFVIGQFIKNHGTKLYRDGGRTDIYTQTIEDSLPDLFNDINGFVASTIAKDLK